MIGHKNHPEVIGTMGQLPKGEVLLIEKIEDVNHIKLSKDKIAYITQTTLSIDDTKEIIAALCKKFPKIKAPLKSDICYATTNRQMAVKNIAAKCDVFFVVGSRQSSNSQRLVEVAKKSGSKESFLVHQGFELSKKLLRMQNVLVYLLEHQRQKFWWINYSIKSKKFETLKLKKLKLLKRMLNLNFQKN